MDQSGKIYQGYVTKISLLARPTDTCFITSDKCPRVAKRAE